MSNRSISLSSRLACALLITAVSGFGTLALLLWIFNEPINDLVPQHRNEMLVRTLMHAKSARYDAFIRKNVSRDPGAKSYATFDFELHRTESGETLVINQPLSTGMSFNDVRGRIFDSYKQARLDIQIPLVEAESNEATQEAWRFLHGDHTEMRLHFFSGGWSRRVTQAPKGWAVAAAASISCLILYMIGRIAWNLFGAGEEKRMSQEITGVERGSPLIS